MGKSRGIVVDLSARKCLWVGILVNDRGHLLIHSCGAFLETENTGRSCWSWQLEGGES